METRTLYEQMGGADTVRRLVEAFYPRVQRDADLQDLFPPDIRPVMAKQYMFLTQFFGGPNLYNQKHGHPMLRARHMAFPIDQRRARAWLRCMSSAMEDVGLTGDLRDELFAKLTHTAHHMINQNDLT